MGGCFKVKNEQHKGNHQEDQAKPVDGQDAQAINGQRQTNGPDEASNPAARAGQLNQNRLHTNGQQQKDQVGIGEQLKQFFDKGLFKCFWSQIASV